ncbi:MAG: GGDEF domain-containing protein [Saccharofermentans sp.]|nr:GGDEF domain-containing protein [Saccharofermentans sp.]
MDSIKAKKLSYIVNTVLLFFVLFLLGFFYICDATFMIKFSIPTTCVYLINYALIKTNKLHLFVQLTYYWIILYMTFATLCLGFNMGFHLYCMSMVLVIFCTEYIARKIKGSKTGALPISIAIAIVYIACTGIAIWNGPVYETPKIYSNIMLAINSCTVFSFLIIYTQILLGIVYSSEDQLTKMAHTDKLTGLFNRHYTMGVLTEKNSLDKSWLALLDIDGFKKINDTYGHNAGDYVLVSLAEVLNEVCNKCTVARWGGEEFLVYCDNGVDDIQVLEKLRKAVENHKFTFEGKDIAVTITIGATIYDGKFTVDKWIQDADAKLYQGKNNGKNKVVF